MAVIITGGIFLFSDAIAQRGSGKGQGPGMMQGRGMIQLEQLDLTSEQQMRIAEIMANHRAENRLMRGNRPALRRAWIDPPREEIMEVLTPEQREKFEELRINRQNIRRQYSETYSRTMIQGIAGKMELDAEKTAAILDLNAKHRKSMQALRDSEISGEISWTEFRNKSDELRLDHRKAMQDVLTEEEYAEWQSAMWGNRSGWNYGNRRRPADRGARMGRRGPQRGNW
jgi:hypothetical protein